ncbi:MAG: amidohydrolase family protein [Candidatus Lokiarchaeota archaeon]|nr:amidohydrolase family protein [Candidatus Lokiarchaeota archaeon]
MLTANIEQEGKTRVENIFVIDSHSHLGEDVDGATMMNPLAPGTGTFDFWGNVQGRVKSDWATTGEQSFSTNMDGKHTKISWEFNPYPFTDNLYIALESLGKRHSDLKSKSKFYSFIDQGVVFPFQDVFRDKHPEARYRASNINVSRFTTRFPFSMKLIGYGRCDPMEGEKALNEVSYARQELGLRGIKLHPRSERWIDDIKSGNPLRVLVEAAKHSLPVIFDTRGRGSILDIAELIKSTRSVIIQQNPALLPHFKVIIAHFAQGNIGDYEVYNALVQPNTYGDLSMLHGEGAGNFFEDFRKWFKSQDKKRVDNRDWSEYLLYASDYPYFGDIHAQKLIKYIINKQFFDTGGNIRDVRNIMGLNQIKLLPEYSLPQKKNSDTILPSVLISNASNQEVNPYEVAIKAIAELLTNNKIDISHFCLQFKDSWNEISEDVLLNILKRTSKEEIPIFLTTILKNQLSLIAPLNRDAIWNKFGYKYFNPKDRKFFSALLKQNYLALEEEQAINSLNQIF